jgi:hypothetical protein
MNDQSLVEIISRGIDCLPRDLDGLEARLLFSRLKPKRRDHIRRLAGKNFRCQHVGEREPLRLIGAEVVETDVEGVAAGILGSYWKEIALRPDMHEGREVIPTMLRAKSLHQVILRPRKQRLHGACIVTICESICPHESP